MTIGLVIGIAVLAIVIYCIIHGHITLTTGSAAIELTRLG